MSARRPRHPNTLIGLAAAMLAAFCVSACGSSTRSLDSAKVERAIASSILHEHGLSTSVACPSKVVQQAGHVFTCTARLDVGTYPVTAWRPCAARTSGVAPRQHPPRSLSQADCRA